MELVVTAWTIKFTDDTSFSESTALIEEEFSMSEDDYKENKGDAQQFNNYVTEHQEKLRMKKQKLSMNTSAHEENQFKSRKKMKDNSKWTKCFCIMQCD